MTYNKQLQHQPKNVSRSTAAVHYADEDAAAAVTDPDTAFLSVSQVMMHTAYNPLLPAV